MVVITLHQYLSAIKKSELLHLPKIDVSEEKCHEDPRLPSP